MKSDAESDEGIARNRRKKVTRRDTDASDERSESVSIEEIDGNGTDPNLLKVLQLLQGDSCYEQRSESDEGIARNRRKKVTRRDTDASDERSESVSIEEIDGNGTDPNLLKVLQLLQGDSCYEQRSGEERSSPDKRTK
ncbi:hypothetical protein Tcan_17976 [Toxocara canis]|uniref:Uncharacterized protein n=1 Tax=Toxocara canis TaxID=6265 RepID=A0A0B2V913_TOXCA|nr:hypothetical protein Tcan_17976 [Toxocara canis]